MRFQTLLLSSAALLLVAEPAVAQSTGTQEVETVVVTGQKGSANGLMNAQPVSKESSTITSKFLQTQTSGQTVFQALNLMPGINFTNNDPYGTSGGNIRMHGQDGNHISVTLDGMPLNDTGNYATYTNQMIDPEVIDRVTANQGSTDVDSPTAAATGGVIAIISDKPHDEFGAEGVFSVGSYDEKRFFGRIDTGEIGPWDTKAFLSASYQDYDKFKGPGDLRKLQFNAKMQQDFGSTGWITLAAHWNTNRNDSYYSEAYAPSVAGFDPGIAKVIDIVKDPNGGGYIGNSANTTTTLQGVGWDRDFKSSCAYTAPKQGVADNTMTTCNYWYRVKVNPSDTGNIRMQSLWHLTDALTLTADASLQYVLANGGGFFSFKENTAQLIGNSAGPPAKTTTPYGCIPGAGCDLNGDGDVLDTVDLYQPSTTNTRRWGFNSSLIYAFDDFNTVQLAYTLDYGLHRQTGTASVVDPITGPYDPFAGLKDHVHEVLDATGVPLRYRDRKSKAIMNQAAFDYEGRYLNDTLRASIGFRLPFLERDLNQYCYEQVGTTSAYCTTQTPTARAADNTVMFAGNSNKYVAPDHTVKRYNRLLPHLGLTYMPFGDDHQFFGTYTQEIAAPRTDNLYTASLVDPTNKNSAWSAFAHTKPETSTTYQVGYRYLGEDLKSSIALWNSQVKNRIVSSFDQNTNTYFDHNVQGVNFWGVDFESNYAVTDKFSLYGNASYTRARITVNIPVGVGFAQTYDKQLSETPMWELSSRAQFDPIPVLHLGLNAKYTGRRYATEDNNLALPDYFVIDADVALDFDDFGLPGTSLKFDATNLTNKHYFGSVGAQTCWTPMAGKTVSGCTNVPTAYLGSPQTLQLTLTARY